MGSKEKVIDIYLGEKTEDDTIAYRIFIPLFFRAFFRSCEDNIRTALDIKFPSYRVTMQWEENDPPVVVTPSNPIVREKVIRLVSEMMDDARDIFN